MEGQPPQCSVVNGAMAPKRRPRNKGPSQMRRDLRRGMNPWGPGPVKLLQATPKSRAAQRPEDEQLRLVAKVQKLFREWPASRVAWERHCRLRSAGPNPGGLASIQRRPRGQVSRVLTTCRSSWTGGCLGLGKSLITC